MIYKRFKNTYFYLVLSLFLSLNSCKESKAQKLEQKTPKVSIEIITAAQQTKSYLKLLKNKNIAVVANQTTIISTKNKKHIHLIDSLLALNISIKKTDDDKSPPKAKKPKKRTGIPSTTAKQTIVTNEIDNS